MKACHWLGCLAIVVVGGVRGAFADISATDLQIAARVLSFMESPLSGRVRLGVVYASEIPRSRNQAEGLMDEFGRGLTVGALELLPVLVPLDAAATADVDLFLLTEHLPASADTLAAVSERRRIPCLTTDVEQVVRGACTVAVRSRPRVEIIVNRGAALDAGVRFATAFRVMVTEI